MIVTVSGHPGGRSASVPAGAGDLQPIRAGELEEISHALFTLLRDFAILRLADAHQAPRTLFHLVRELIQIFGRNPQILDGSANVVVIGPDYGLYTANQALRLLHGLL